MKDLKRLLPLLLKLHRSEKRVGPDVIHGLKGRGNCRDCLIRRRKKILKLPIPIPRKASYCFRQ